MFGNAGKILVIDDDDLTLTILRKLLEAENFEVEVCSSGPDALDLLRAKPYDALLCDMWMNGMTGRDFYLRLKDEYPDYLRKIIFITGDIASESTWEFIDERHLPYVIKPISRPLLRQRVTEIVGERLLTPVVVPVKPVWDGVNRRRHRRVRFDTKAHLRRKKWEVGRPDIAAVSNASRGGLYFVSEREYRVGMELLVAHPYTGYEDVEQDGYVVRVEEFGEGKRGVGLALGEEAVLARAAYAGSSEDVRKHHIWSPTDVSNEPLSLGVFTGARQAGEEDNSRRMFEEIAELRHVHDGVLDKNDRLAAEAAALKKKLAEVEAALIEGSKTVDGMQRQMQSYEKKIEETKDTEYRATHDALTGLWNRGAILDLLKRELVRGDREGTAVGVLLADLDFFKNVNDTYGHLAGDGVLRETSRRINAAVRSYDSVGRYGGEEFLVVLAGCENNDDMVKQAERIRTTVGAEPVETENCVISVTLSMGVASSAEIEELEELLRAADTALYRAKRGGRNRVEMASAAEAGSS